MKAGDLPTTRALLYVALGAIALAIVEAIPSDFYGREVTVPREVIHAAVQAPDPTPAQVATDAFSSPILARRAKGGIAIGAPNPTSAVEPLNPQMTGMLLDAARVPSPQQVSASRSTPENTGTSRHVERERKRTILVSGIVAVGDPVALIAVDGKECLPRRVGEQLGPGIKLLAIKDSKVVIGFGHQWKVIYLGQVTEL